MSGKKHVFKMVPGRELLNKTGMKIFCAFTNEELTRNYFNKVLFVPLNDEDDRVLDLPIQFYSSAQSGSSIPVECIYENGQDLKQTSYRCDRSTDIITNCKAEDPFQQIPSIYANPLYSFGYINGKLMMISTRYKISDSPSGFSNFDPFLRVVPVEYQYITREYDDRGYSYRDYFSNDRGDDIHSPHNLILQYAEKHVKEEVIEDILSKIPEDMMLSKAFAKIFVERLTENQLETLANTLNNEHLQALAENLTDEQLQTLVDHLTNHQLQTLAQEINPEKLQIIVPILNDAQLEALVRDLNPEQVKEILPHLKVDQFKALIKTLNDEQFTVLAKDLAEHHLTILSKELEGDQLKALVNSLQEDQLKDLVNKLDPEKLEAIAQDLTDSNRIQMIIKSLADNPEKLQAFAHNMPDQQFAKLLNELNAESLKDIIHKLPYEKVTAVIGDLGNQDQSKAIIDALKEKFDEQNKKQEEMKEKLEELKELLEGDDIVNPNQFSYQHSSCSK